MVGLFNDHQTQVERAINALLSRYREANARVRTTKAPKRFAQAYHLQRYEAEQTVLTPAAREELRQAIENSQSVLMEQVSAIHTQFDRAVERYHEIDVLVPGGSHGAPQVAPA
jgi:hypothetical protein